MSGTSTTRALSVCIIELPGETIPPGTEFDCPTVDYETFVKLGAVKPVAAPKAKRTRKPAAAMVEDDAALALQQAATFAADDPPAEDDLV